MKEKDAGTVDAAVVLDSIFLLPQLARERDNRTVIAEEGNELRARVKFGSEPLDGYE